MILAEQFCLLALNPTSGETHAAQDRARFLHALGGLVLVDLIGSGRFVQQGDQLRIADSMPLAHPVLADAAQRLARLGPTFTVAAATAVLARAAKGWQDRMRKGLVARDVLEVTSPFPFVRRYRLRSRQAWNECVDPMKALASGGVAEDAAIALALAIHSAAILGELFDPATARALVTRLPKREMTIAAIANKHAWLARIITLP